MKLYRGDIWRAMQLPTFGERRAALRAMITELFNRSTRQDDIIADLKGLPDSPSFSAWRDRLPLEVMIGILTHAFGTAGTNHGEIRDYDVMHVSIQPFIEAGQNPTAHGYAPPTRKGGGGGKHMYCWPKEMDDDVVKHYEKYSKEFADVFSDTDLPVTAHKAVTTTTIVVDDLVNHHDTTPATTPATKEHTMDQNVTTSDTLDKIGDRFGELVKSHTPDAAIIMAVKEITGADITSDEDRAKVLNAIMGRAVATADVPAGTTVSVGSITLPPDTTDIINKLLAMNKVGVTIESLIAKGNESVALEKAVADARQEKNKASQACERAAKELADVRLEKGHLEAEIKRLNKLAGASEFKPVVAGSMPNGKSKRVDANTVFGGVAAYGGMQATVWEWDAPHPLVPAVDAEYELRPEHVKQVLWGMENGKNIYIKGDTGTGKSTLVEQVAAHLNMPLVRVNLDSDMSRMDLVGRDVLKNDGGATKSEFIEGPLPQALKMPCILLIDEIDAGRPDILYTLQRVLEGKGLLIAENGNQLILPHPMMRIIATANTVGQGDETGVYPAVRALSGATLDRFEVWMDVDYLDVGKETKLLQKRVPGLPEKTAKQMALFAKECRSAFRGGQIMQAVSLRGLVTMGEALVAFKDAEVALNMTILKKASSMDRATIAGLASRFKIDL